MFSDKFINSPVSSVSGKKADKSGNLALIKELTDWTLGEKSVLRVKSVKHHLVGKNQSPEAYTVEDDVEFTIEIEELKDGKWVGYAAKDVQMEFVRIDPFIRTTMKSNSKFFPVCPPPPKRKESQ